MANELDITKKDLTENDQKDSEDFVLTNPDLYDKLVSTIGFILLVISLISCPLSLYYLIFGSNYIRSLIVLLLTYQIFIAKKNKYWLSICKFVEPFNYFNTYGYIIDKKDSDNIQEVVKPVLNNEKSLFCFHPHGILTLGLLILSVTNKIIGKSNILGSRALLYTPITGLFTKWFGIQSVNPARFSNIMDKGQNISFVPGGFEEATITNHNKDRVYINSRKGFIKYALKYGYKVHPIYTFNESRLFLTMNYFENFRLILNRFKIPTVFFLGKVFGLPDYSQKLVTVISSGLNFPQIENPTKEDVEIYHKKYICELEYLYYKYRERFGGSEVLEIF
jgi:hypothetical protein